MKTDPSGIDSLFYRKGRDGWKFRRWAILVKWFFPRAAFAALILGYPYIAVVGLLYWVFCIFKMDDEFKDWDDWGY